MLVPKALVNCDAHLCRINTVHTPHSADTQPHAEVKILASIAPPYVFPEITPNRGTDVPLLSRLLPALGFSFSIERTNESDFIALGDRVEEERFDMLLPAVDRTVGVSGYQFSPGVDDGRFTFLTRLMSNDRNGILLKKVSVELYLLAVSTLAAILIIRRLGVFTAGGVRCQLTGWFFALTVLLSVYSNYLAIYFHASAPAPPLFRTFAELDSLLATKVCRLVYSRGMELDEPASYIALQAMRERGHTDLTPEIGHFRTLRYHKPEVVPLHRDTARIVEAGSRECIVGTSYVSVRPLIEATYCRLRYVQPPGSHGGGKAWLLRQDSPLTIPLITLMLQGTFADFHARFLNLLLAEAKLEWNQSLSKYAEK